MALSLSVLAAKEIKNYLTGRGHGLGIRLLVETSDCNGMAYKLEFVDTVEDTDLRYESHGAWLFIDPKSLVYADGTLIDFVDDGLEGGFAINNPNVKNHCGCGESFYVWYLLLRRLIMKVFLRIVLLALVAIGAHAGEVSVNGVKQAAVIDVRTPEEFAAGHIDGAINIPLDQIQNGSAHFENFKKDSPILLYCRSGRRSGIAQQLLEQQGYSKLTNGGGVSALAKQLNLCNARIC